jgi:hypothetical protein
MSEDIMQLLKDAFEEIGVKSLPIDEIESVCKVIAEEEHIGLLTTDKEFSIRSKLQLPIKVILKSNLGLEGLLVLVGHLDNRRWDYILANLVADDPTNVRKTIRILQKGVSAKTAYPLMFVCCQLRDRYREEFVKEYINSLNESWDGSGLILSLSLFDSNDTELVAPLTEYLNKFEQASGPQAVREQKDRVTRSLKNTLKKITKKTKKWWEFWK